MIVVVLGIVAAVVLLWCLREHRADDPRRRHPSTGGATKPNPWTQSVRVRIVTLTESDNAAESDDQ